MLGEPGGELPDVPRLGDNVSVFVNNEHRFRIIGAPGEAVFCASELKCEADGVGVEFIHRVTVNVGVAAKDKGCCCKVGGEQRRLSFSFPDGRCVWAFSGRLKDPVDDHRVRVFAQLCNSALDDSNERLFSTTVDNLAILLEDCSRLRVR